MQNSRRHIFISYSQDDAALVSNRILKRLEDAPLRFWQDIVDLKPGELWQASIDRALRNAAAVVLVLSPASLASRYVAYEWAYAIGARIPLIPVLVRPVERLHPKLTTIQYVDFTAGRDKPWLRLIDALRAVMRPNRGRGLELRAEFELEEGVPRRVGREFVIDLSLDGVPGGALRAVYEIYDDSFSEPRWVEKNPQKRFETWCSSYGDAPISVDVETPKRTLRIETTLFAALFRTHGRSSSPRIQKALHYIEQH